MTTAHRARSIRRRGSSNAGKNEPERSLGMRSSTSPALVDSSRPPAAIAVGRALVAPLVASGANRLGGLELDELLEHERHRLAQDVLAAAGADRVEQLGQGRLWQGHRCL